MCGICGQFNFRDGQPVRLENIKKMANALAHRGPDDQGYYISGALGLGFRRLSIIDLDGGRQPMSDQQQSVWVIFNGEIYNFATLRQELEAYGHVFRTKSDTEVIVHGYKQWGDEVLEHLNGMFGLAIWDEKKRRLLLARDRLGIKMLYYKLTAEHLCFGSEIRALLACEEEKPEVDPVAVNLFLRYRYTPSPFTAFKGITKLAPGCRLIIENGSPHLARWWNYQPVPFDSMPAVEQAEENLLELYQRAVKRQLMSDVPLGLLLSGGLDSGLLLAMMSRHGNSWKTYSAGFGSDFRADELAASAQTAKLFHAPNFGIKTDRPTFDAILAKVTAVLEEPVAASSVVPMYQLCQRAREDVKVVLMGQGPDELFGGYRRHLGVRYGHYWRKLPAWLRQPLRAGLAGLPRNEAIKRALYSLHAPERMQRYRSVFSLLPGESIDDLFQPGILLPDAGDKIFECWQELGPLMQHTDELGGLQFLEIRSSLPDELLMYGDKLSMAHGLEARVPYLDHEIVEYAERLPASFKVHNGVGKWLHRRVCEKFLPREILRRKKHGFATPVDEWFRQALAGKFEQALLDDRSLLYQYLRPQAVQRLVKEHRSRRCDHHKILFSLVIFDEWLRHYFA